MWTVTVDGFYSVTAFDERRGIPARCRRARRGAGSREGRPRAPLAIRSSRRDPRDSPSAYPFRIVCRRDEWARYLAASVDEIDYLNFKDRVAQRLGKRRHDVLLSVWATLRRLEEDRA